MDQPRPFEIVRQEGHPTVATNGALALMCLENDGSVRLRRAVRTQSGGPLAETLLPQLNALAGEVLQNADLDRGVVRARLRALQLMCEEPVRENIEWAYAELGGVRVYVDGSTGTVVVTRQDLTP